MEIQATTITALSIKLIWLGVSDVDCLRLLFYSPILDSLKKKLSDCPHSVCPVSPPTDGVCPLYIRGGEGGAPINYITSIVEASLGKSESSTAHYQKIARLSRGLTQA